jgi:hypothetical protein
VKHGKLLIGVTALFVAVVLVACTAIQCRLKDRAVTQLSLATAAFLECANPKAIAADFDKAAQALGLCKKTQTGPLADALCKPIIESVVGSFVGNLPPQAWQCKATKAKDAVVRFLTEQCQKLPVDF